MESAEGVAGVLQPPSILVNSRWNLCWLTTYWRQVLAAVHAYLGLPSLQWYMHQ